MIAIESIVFVPLEVHLNMWKLTEHMIKFAVLLVAFSIVRCNVSLDDISLLLY